MGLWGRLRRRYLAASAAALAALATATAAGAATWSLQSVPAFQESNGQLFSVSCSSKTSCMAVGFYIDPTGLQRPMSEAWNGSSWTLESVPMPPNIPYGFLHGVSCTSATACTAVGATGFGASTNAPLAERWNGSSWKIQSVPNPGSSEIALNAVSCDAATFCTAVGGAFLGGKSAPLAEHWNGASWAIQSTPDPAGATQTTLSGVACNGNSACIAVGDYTTNSGGFTPTKSLAERWNGSSWHVQSTPNPSSSTAVRLDAVSCSAATACTAVGGSATSGTFPNKTLAERWNGSSWAIQTTPNPGSGAPSLTGVSCPTASDCTAVGTPLGSQVPVVERWNGTSWSSQSAPSPAGAVFTQLTGVSCTAASACTGVGGSAASSEIPQSTVAERWNGAAWALQTTANKQGADMSVLTAVSCSTAMSCTAVGNVNRVDGRQRMLAEAWNGASWSIQSVQNPSASTGTFNGVSCTSATACTAVGSYLNGGNATVTLAERWNGSTWNVQSTPSPSGATRSTLNAVSCASATSCMAVGNWLNGNTGHVLRLAEKWNGSTWNVLATQNKANETYSSLTGVSCATSTDCTTVGGFSTTANAPQADKLLAEQWNGSNWVITTTPTPGGATFATFAGVSCSAAGACTGAGGYSTTNGATQPSAPLAERWNGSSWTIQSTLNPSSAGFNGAACSAATSCSAVGGFGGIFAESWNGATWGSDTVAFPANASGDFAGVSCTSATDCTLAGQALSNYMSVPIFAVTEFVGVMKVPLAERDPALPAP